MEGGESDSVTTTTNDTSQAYSDNISFNSSSISVYSAEEQIIKQRGRRSPRKKSLNDEHQLSQQPQQQLQIPQPYSSKRSLLRTPIKKRLRLTSRTCRKRRSLRTSC